LAAGRHAVRMMHVILTIAAGMAAGRRRPARIMDVIIVMTAGMAATTAEEMPPPFLAVEALVVWVLRLLVGSVRGSQSMNRMLHAEPEGIATSGGAKRILWLQTTFGRARGHQGIQGNPGVHRAVNVVRVPWLPLVKSPFWGQSCTASERAVVLARWHKLRCCCSSCPLVVHKAPAPVSGQSLS